MGTATESELTGAELQIWIDAQLPPALARWFKTELDTAAVHVAHIDLLDASDPAIFSASRAADRPVGILTKDDDFSRLVNQHGPPPQVVWLR